MTAARRETHREFQEVGGTVPVHAALGGQAVVTIEDVREVALGLPRSYEAFVRGRVKFRVGRIVYLAFSRDETLMGFGFPKEEREWLVGTEPEKFMMPRESDLRYNWVVVRLAAIDEVEMRELVIDAWSMVVPKHLSASYREPQGDENVEAPRSTQMTTAAGRQDAPGRTPSQGGADARQDRAHRNPGGRHRQEP
jgi:hypothetical protein